MDYNWSLAHKLLKRGRSGKWDLRSDAPEIVKKYLMGYRSPSVRWPLSYVRAISTKKFEKEILPMI